jgi:hypothetical protein
MCNWAKRIMRGRLYRSEDRYLALQPDVSGNCGANAKREGIRFRAKAAVVSRSIRESSHEVIDRRQSASAPLGGTQEQVATLWASRCFPWGPYYGPSLEASEKIVGRGPNFVRLGYPGGWNCSGLLVNCIEGISWVPQQR